MYLHGLHWVETIAIAKMRAKMRELGLALRPRLNASPVCVAKRRCGCIYGLWRCIGAEPLRFSEPLSGNDYLHSPDELRCYSAQDARCVC